MEAAASAAFFDENQLYNRKQSLFEPFKALCHRLSVSYINILVQVTVDPNQK